MHLKGSSVDAFIATKKWKSNPLNIKSTIAWIFVYLRSQSSQYHYPFFIVIFQLYLCSAIFRPGNDFVLKHFGRVGILELTFSPSGLDSKVGSDVGKVGAAVVKPANPCALNHVGNVVEIDYWVSDLQSSVLEATISNCKKRWKRNIICQKYNSKMGVLKVGLRGSVVKDTLHATSFLWRMENRRWGKATHFFERTLHGEKSVKSRKYTHVLSQRGKCSYLVLWYGMRFLYSTGFPILVRGLLLRR